MKAAKGQGGLEVPPVGFICRTPLWRNKLIPKVCRPEFTWTNPGYPYVRDPTGLDYPNLLFPSSALSGLMELMNLPKVPGGFLSVFLM